MTLIESGLFLTYQPWSNVMIHGGYRFLYLGGVGTAPSNYANFNEVSTSGSVLFHGPVVGLTVRFGGPAAPLPVEQPSVASAAPRMWTFWGSGEYVYMKRYSGDNRALAVFDPDASAPFATAITSEDARLRARSGFRVGGGFSWNGGISALEGSYMNISTYRERGASVRDPGEDLESTFLEGNSFAAFHDSFVFSASRKSSFHTFEINYRTMVADWSAFRVDFLAGFRYAYFADRLNVDAVDEPTFATDQLGFYTGRTRNTMYGAQIGVVLDRPLIEFWWPGFGIKFDMKAGLLANSAKNEQLVVDYDEPSTLSTSVRRTAFAAMIESGIRLTYSPWRHVEIHGGYQFTWLKGVATAPNNIGNFHAINTSGSVLFHGPTVGATIRF